MQPPTFLAQTAHFLVRTECYKIINPTGHVVNSTKVVHFSAVGQAQECLQELRAGAMQMGGLYESGLGAPMNYGEAYRWFTLAAHGGQVESRRVLTEFTKIMTKTQFRNGEARYNNPTLPAQKLRFE